MVLIATFVSSVFHYTDNTVRIDDYPQQSVEFGRAMVAITWVQFTIFGVLGYVLFGRGRMLPAAACLAFYSVSGLLSPLHYTEGSWSEFDVFQHTFILTDAITGLGVLAFAGWLALAQRRSSAASEDRAG